MYTHIIIGNVNKFHDKGLLIVKSNNGVNLIFTK